MLGAMSLTSIFVELGLPESFASNLESSGFTIEALKTRLQSRSGDKRSKFIDRLLGYGDPDKILKAIQIEDCREWLEQVRFTWPSVFF